MNEVVAELVLGLAQLPHERPGEPHSAQDDRGDLADADRPTPAARARSSTTSRWLRGSFDGTCQARPQALGSVPAVTSMRATSSVNDQVCGRSAWPSTETFFPCLNVPDDPLAHRALRARADEVGGADLRHPDPPGLMRGQRVVPDAGPDPPLGTRRGQRRGLRHRVRLVVAAGASGTVAVQVGQRDQYRAAAFRGAEHAGGDRRPVGRRVVRAG